MIVHVVVLDPQGGVGGFEWNEDQSLLLRWVLDHPDVPILGWATAEVDSRLTVEECTDQIDSQLDELELIAT